MLTLSVNTEEGDRRQETASLQNNTLVLLRTKLLTKAGGEPEKIVLACAYKQGVFISNL